MNVPVTVGLAIMWYLICQHFSTKSRCDIWSLTVAQLMSSVNSKLTSGCPVSLLRALLRYCLSQTEYLQYWKWWERRTSNYSMSWLGFSTTFLQFMAHVLSLFLCWYISQQPDVDCIYTIKHQEPLCEPVVLVDFLHRLHVKCYLIFI